MRLRKTIMCADKLHSLKRLQKADQLLFKKKKKAKAQEWKKVFEDVYKENGKTLNHARIIWAQTIEFEKDYNEN